MPFFLSFSPNTSEILPSVSFASVVSPLVRPFRSMAADFDIG